METRLAKIISSIFHPLLMPTMGIFILLNLDIYLNFTITQAGKIAVYSIVFINTAIIPAFLVYFQFRLRLINSLTMEDQKDRIFPFLITSFFYFFCFYILKKNNLPSAVCFFMLGTAISVALAWLINFFWKISVHSIGAGGIIGLLIGISRIMEAEISPLLFLSVLIAGLVGFARLKLNAHNYHQVYAGFLLGFFIIVGTLMLQPFDFFY